MNSSFNADNGEKQPLSIYDPIISLSLPLAAAIREVRNRFSAHARPIPQDLTKYLSAIIPKKLLKRVRYAVGDVKVLIPKGVTHSGIMFANDSAIVADDIIVFSREPGLDDPNDIKWWAHELQHAYQFMNWGVDFFAYRFAKHADRVESRGSSSCLLCGKLWVRNWVARSR